MGVPVDRGRFLGTYWLCGSQRVWCDWTGLAGVPWTRWFLLVLLYLDTGLVLGTGYLIDTCCSFINLNAKVLPLRFIASLYNYVLL